MDHRHMDPRYMDIEYPGFGRIVVDGREFDHDVVIEAGKVRRRKKGASKRYRARYGHTPLSEDEDLPWKAATLVIGTGASGRLPVMPGVEAEAARRGIELIVLPTLEACELLRNMDPASSAAAVLHVTC